MVYRIEIYSSGGELLIMERAYTDQGVRSIVNQSLRMLQKVNFRIWLEPEAVALGALGLEGAVA